MPPSAGSWDEKDTYEEIKTILHITDKTEFQQPLVVLFTGCSKHPVQPSLSLDQGTPEHLAKFTVILSWTEPIPTKSSSEQVGLYGVEAAHTFCHQAPAVRTANLSYNNPG